MPLRLTLLGWQDLWVMFPFYTPQSISSDFVRQAIEFGLQNGWKPDARGAAFEVEWRDEEFRLPAQTTK
ncbi:hypothetical protein EON83_00680 [bacterium]|nr:MAG: hypothetical protein EON83_00680 [bacterium]